MSKTFDLTLLPLYRLNGNEMPSQPGLLALTPPRRKARNRARDLLFMHLALSGNVAFSTANYLRATSHAAEEFYKTSGSVTAALRAAAIMLNGDLLEHNMEAGGQGRYILATLVLGAVRGEQLYILESGPAHVYWMAGDERKDIHDPEMSGRGLGLGQSTRFYLSQLPLRARGRMLIAPELPAGWMPILQRDNQSASLETIRSVLMRQNMDDQNAVLIEVQSGRGAVTILKPPPSPKPTLASISRKTTEEQPPEEKVEEKEEIVEIKSHQPEPQPIKRDHQEDLPPIERKDEGELAPSVHSESKSPQERPALTSIPQKTRVPVPDIEENELLKSIPRQMPKEEGEQKEEIETFEPKYEEEEVDTRPPISEVIVRQSARNLAKGMQVTREGNDKLKDTFAKIMPRILPADAPNAPLRLPNWVMGLIAVIIPLVVVTIASVVYFRFGHDIQYETAYAKVEVARARALEQIDPVAQRVAWENTIKAVDAAEEYDKTAETEAIRTEAQRNLDTLLGIQRLNFHLAVKDLPRGIEIVAMEATDNELFILDANSGKILRAFLVSGGYQYDDNFTCKSGEYNGENVGTLIALQALPKTNAMGTSVMGIDSKGTLIYCADNQVPQAISLQKPPIDFKEITAITLDADVLYLLDALSREVWVYSGRASTFIDYPTSFFENAPQGIENAIDINVTGNDLYLLFEDGHLANCVYSLFDTVPTRCTNPVNFSDRHPAAGGGNNFEQALFTEIYLSTPPDSALLLFEPKTQSVYRFSPRSFNLLNRLQPIEGTIPKGSLSTMVSNPSHLLFLAQGDKVYMAADIR